MSDFENGGKHEGGDEGGRAGTRGAAGARTAGDGAEGGRVGRASGCGSSSWWEERSLAEKILLGVGMGILGLGLMAAFGWVVMALWNWLMPELFGLKRIDYWKAWGLLALCTILFKGMGSGGGDRGGDRRRKRELKRYMREGGASAEE